MKKRVAFISACVMSILLIGCGNVESSLNQASTTDTVTSDSEENTSQGAWFMPIEVDEFGDVVEDSDHVGIKSVATGEFSNTATQSSSLQVEILDTIVTNHVFCFTLLEYDKTPATYLSSSNLSMKIKVNNEIKEYHLDGSEPNGPVFLGINSTDGNDVFNELYAGNDVRCIIYIDSSEYHFTISSQGFQEICAKAQERKDEITEKNRIKDIPSVIDNILVLEDGAAKLHEAFQFLIDSRDDYTLMSDEDIKQEINGDFYYVSLSEYNDNNITITYRYIMNYSGNTRTQLWYYKNGVGTDPEKQDSSSSFNYSNGIIEDLHPCQLRKMTDGYYVAYAGEPDYATPRWVIMKGHFDESSGMFVADYPLS